jgi:raffinose/stachyose/melibiose transport system permease protein
MSENVNPGVAAGAAIAELDDLARDDAAAAKARRPFPWHVVVFLAPAVLIYTVVMILPLAETLRLSFFMRTETGQSYFAGLENFRLLLFDPRWSNEFWNALWNNFYFFIIHMLVQNPIGIALAALLSMPRLPGRTFYRTAIFVPAMLSVVIIGFAWKLILSPAWGVAETLLGSVGLAHLFQPWLGLESTALTTLSLISVWQYVGIPLMLIYAALLNIPEEVIEAAELDDVKGFALFFKVKLPLILPTIGIISILTFIGNFNAFDLIYATQGALGGPNYATDILGTLLYRVFFGHQLVLGDPNMGAAIATVMFLIILVGVVIYLFGVQRRLQRYQF